MLIKHTFTSDNRARGNRAGRRLDNAGTAQRQRVAQPIGAGNDRFARRHAAVAMTTRITKKAIFIIIDCIIVRCRLEIVL
jgi:hypothetical protein